MKCEIDSPERIPIAQRSAIRFAIVYEDFESGTRARSFAEELAQRLSAPCSLSGCMWRSELLDSPRIAADAAFAAADFSYLIISLRGDRDLSPATRQWIEAQLAAAGEHAAGVIVLSNPRHATWRVIAGIRHFLRAVCTANGITFFSHAATPAREGEAEDSRDAEGAARGAAGRWTPAPLPA